VNVLLVIPEICFPSRSPQQPVSLRARTRVDWINSLLADLRILEEGIVGSAAKVMVNLMYFDRIRSFKYFTEIADFLNTERQTFNRSWLFKWRYKHTHTHTHTHTHAPKQQKSILSVTRNLETKHLHEIYHSAELIDLFLKIVEWIGTLKIELWPSLITDPEKTCLELKPYIRIQDVLGSNLVLETGYCDERFSLFLNYDHFLPKSFPVQQPSFRLTI
jgi:hypothetical protein